MTTEAKLREQIAALTTERDRLRDVVEHHADNGEQTFRVAMLSNTDCITLVVTGPKDREEDMAKTLAGLIDVTMILSYDTVKESRRLAEVERDLAIEGRDNALMSAAGGDVLALPAKGGEA